jgi:hypothetical protein
MSPNVSPVEALQRIVGASVSSARILAGVGAAMDQPLARDATDELNRASLRSQGALVLAPVRLP